MVERLNRPAPLSQPVVIPRVGSPEIQRAFDTFSQALDSVIRLLRPLAQPEAWQPVTFQSTWGDTGDPYFRAAFRKNPLGRVELRGVVSRSGGAVSSIFVLPAGYRPASTLIISTYTSSGYASITVDNTGLVSSFGIGAGAVTLALDAVNFEAA